MGSTLSGTADRVFFSHHIAYPSVFEAFRKASFLAPRHPLGIRMLQRPLVEAQIEKQPYVVCGRW
jgi:hypothetical protein